MQNYKISMYIIYMVVSQAINPNWAAAQNWSQPFWAHFVVFLGRNKPPFKILAKSVEKHGSYINFSAAVAAREICPKGVN